MVDRPEGSVRKQHGDAWVPRAATNAIESRQIAHATGQECHAPTPCQSRVWPGEKGFTTLPPKSSANFCDRAPPARSQSRSVPATAAGACIVDSRDRHRQQEDEKLKADYQAIGQSTMTSTCASTFASRQTSPWSSTTQIETDLRDTSIPVK